MSDPPSPKARSRNQGLISRISVERSTIAPSVRDSPRPDGGSSPKTPSFSFQSTAIPTPTRSYSRVSGPAIPEEGGCRDDANSAESREVYGWPKLAEKMQDVPEFRCFSRFERLNMKTLLYYQVELAVLEDELRRQEGYNCKAVKENDCDDYAMQAEQMVPLTSEMQSEKPPNLQWKIILRIRETMKEYNNFLLQFTQVSQLPNATESDTKALSDWLSHDKGGNGKITGLGSTAWEIEHPDEKKKSRRRLVADLLLSIVGMGKNASRQVPSLLSTIPKENCDNLSLWIRDEANLFWRKFWEPVDKRDEESKISKGSSEEKTPKDADPVRRTSGSSIVRITSIMSFMTACVLPIGGIAILAVVKPLPTRIGLIAVFSFIVSGVLLLIANCTRKDVFMATAAFSAVLVVFVQNA